MLLRGSNNRGARGQQPNRSRGSRGRGSTSRGASSSSGKSSHETPLPSGPQALCDSSNTHRGGYRGKNFRHNYSEFPKADASSTPASSNLFEQERLENAAKREQRGQNGTTVNGRGGRGAPRGSFNKQVRFTDPPTEQNGGPFVKAPSPAAPNPFETTKTIASPQFGSANPTHFNPFAVGAKSVNPFNTPAPNPFGTPSQSTSSPPVPSIFGVPSASQGDKTSSSPFGKPSTSVFGAPSAPQPNPFGAPPKTNGITSAASSLNSSSSQSNSNPFAPSKKAAFGGFSTNPMASPSNTFGTRTPTSSTPNPKNKNASNPRPTTNGTISAKKPPTNSALSSAATPNTSGLSSNALAMRMEQLLRKQGITPPSWPTANPGDPKQKEAVKLYWQTPLKGYRNRVRESLIRAGFLDDPDKPKKLSEAIDFKGTCEDMCPEFEKFTRIVDHSVDSAEKETAPDGSLWPSMGKMVKALARSAAGQDAPLPMDVRTPAALRRTLDYLLHTVLGDEGHLPAVHGFLWDRTRAIRRDFVFQSAMSPTELSDQIYCLERITRFHVIALHQMSKDDVVAEDFSEQQEVEQLGKALLSLIHAYEDCNAQGITCENEAEFRAYYVLFNSHNSGILETVQDWGWKFWGESDDIRTAVTLVEALQNIWDTRGPLKPHSATDIAQNAYSKFFSIIEDRKVSYTMACFAEIHFNSVRKSILKTILASYRKQRDQTKDWTLSKLNAYLRFDDEGDIVSFGEAYGLRFDEVDGEECLSFETDDGVSDPFPPLKQQHSYNLVERKRGGHSLPAVIDSTVYEEDEAEDVGEEDELFVKDDSPSRNNHFVPLSTPAPEEKEEQPDSYVTTTIPNTESLQTPAQNMPKPTSTFDQMKPKTLGSGFFTQPPVDKQPVQPSRVQPESPSTFTSQPVQQTPPSFTPTPTVRPPSTQSPPLFSFLTQSLAQPPAGPETPLSLGNHAVTATNTETLKTPLFFGGQSVIKPPTASTENAPAVLTTPNDLSGFPPSQSPLPQPGFPTPPAPPVTTQPSFDFGVQSPAITAKEPAAQPPSEEKKHVQSSTLFGGPAAAPTDRKKQLTGFAQWIALGDDGLLEQFASFQAANIIQETFNNFMAEKAKKAAQEAEILARQEAAAFRYRTLATKYGHLWRQAAHRIWLKRRGREARQARREMAESLRSSRAAQSANVVEDFRASTSRRRRESLESLLDATGVLNGVHDTDDQIRPIVQREELEPASKRQRSERSSDSPSTKTSRHKRGKSDNPLRRSLLSDPSYLSGGSRIHLMSKYDAQDESRRHVSGVQTDYFRLKARGIATLPDGTPLANSAAKDILHHKRSFDGISKPPTPKLAKSQPTARSVPAKPAERPKTSVERDEEIQALKTRAKAVMSREKSQQKRTLQVDDEELFERAKRIREQMDEGAKWFRKEIERETASRSVS